MQFIEHGTIVHDVKSREELAKQIGDAIYNYSSNDLKLSWKADRIHKKVVGLGKLIQKSSNINDVIWYIFILFQINLTMVFVLTIFCRRPKCGDIKQQLKNQSVSHKNEYKQILENELTKITQNTHKKESIVTEQCLKLVEMQKRIQNQHLKLMTLHEKLKNLIRKTQSMNGH